MLFNSIEFGIFLLIVFAAYWALGKHRTYQNTLILIASYVFYGWWDYRFLILIFISSTADYLCGLFIPRMNTKLKKRLLLLTSLIVNIGLLGFFKYYNFFIGSFIDFLGYAGFETHMHTLKIILPVGISFYTFQTLSYTIDIYREKMKPTNNIIDFFAYVSFFPQLVAGPIERAIHLLPQFQNDREFDYASAADGMRQILLGLFKKVVIADGVAHYVSVTFTSYSELNGSTLLLGALLFYFQLYCDFSGYSDIAIGIGRLFGFDLVRNFAYPHLAPNIREFWKRWNISLTSWFRDYIYIPMGGARTGRWKNMRNTMTVFLISGLWHGANWTFIFWGFLHGISFIIYKQFKILSDKLPLPRINPALKYILSVFITFTFIAFATIFFRARDIHSGTLIIKGIFSASLFEEPLFMPVQLIFICLLLIIEWIQRNKEHAFEIAYPYRFNIVFRWSFYLIITALIFMFGSKQQDFIYFQF